MIDKFYRLYEQSPHAATDYLYNLSREVNYIQTKRISQNIIWSHQTEYGEIELTINISKPEKDPRLIALQQLNPKSGYPRCRLCKENEGYRGHVNYDSRSNMRIIPIDLDGERWYFQYSPYSYFAEHSIVLNEHHVPMVINEGTFRKLLAFIDMFPEYFVGSNAGLPIVGGSILDHEHYQAGRCHFPIEKAREIRIGEADGVTVSRLVWPLSTIRARSFSKPALVKFAMKVLARWTEYENFELSLINKPKTSTTPDADRPARKRAYVRSDPSFQLCERRLPCGVFHLIPNFITSKGKHRPDRGDGHGILPGRLKKEFALIARYLKGEEELSTDPSLEKHLHWMKQIKETYVPGTDVDQFIRAEAGKVFSAVLKDAGVFKMDPAGGAAFAAFTAELMR